MLNAFLCLVNMLPIPFITHSRFFLGSLLCFGLFLCTAVQVQVWVFQNAKSEDFICACPSENILRKRNTQKEVLTTSFCVLRIPKNKQAE